MRYVIVDVFTDRPLRGNALCVVLDPCPEGLMQAVAREVNLSETTFPTVRGESAYTMRIFTPASELGFAGHPSLGTAWALGPRRWEQTTSGAAVTIDADAEGAVMTQPDPVIAEVDARGLGEALGLPDVDSAHLADAAGARHLIVPTRHPLDEVRCDAAAVQRIAGEHGAYGACPIHRIDAQTVEARNFLPGLGITEDPGTGSAAGAIGLLARRLFGCAEDLVIRQGEAMGRACRIEVHAELGSIRVGGKVALCAEGEMRVDAG